MRQMEDEVWETRRARICLERRLLVYSRLLELLVPWYALGLVALLILRAQGGQDLVTILSVSMAVCILVFSVVASGSRFRARAADIRNLYVELDRIYRKMLLAKDDTTKQQLLDRYSELLKTTENHSDYDYILVKVVYAGKPGSTVPRPGLGERAYALARRLFFFVAVLIVFAAPLVLGYFILS